MVAPRGWSGVQSVVVRRVAFLTMLALTVPAAAASAAPQTVDISAFRFAPGEVTVNAGEAVTWNFSGPDTNHSVTSEPSGQGESFDSDPGRFPVTSDHPVGDTFRRTFTREGAYTYFCKVHPDMRGTVFVNNADGSPDDANPEITAVRIDSATIRFVVDELVDVVVTIRRVGSRRVLRTINARNRAGRFTLRRPRLKRGSYRATIRAEDKSSVDNTRTVHKRFFVR